MLAFYTANVLIDKNFVAKITDFSYKAVGQRTILWTAPELLPNPSIRLNSSSYTPLLKAQASGASTAAADVYSFGVVLYECLSRREPFEGQDALAAIAGLTAGQLRLPTPEGCGAELAVLLGECLSFEPGRRPLFVEIERRLSALDPACVTSAAFSAADEPATSMLQRLRRGKSTERRRTLSIAQVSNA